MAPPLLNRFDMGPGRRQRHRPAAPAQRASIRRPGRADFAAAGPLVDPCPLQSRSLRGLAPFLTSFCGSVCGNSFAIFSDGRGSGTGSFRGARDRIEAVRHQHHEPHVMAQPARHPAGVRAGAEIEIGARRADDGRARVLRDHQPAERRLRMFGVDRQFALDEERRAVDVQRLVDRDRAARRQRHALRADRLVLVGQIAPRGRKRRSGSAAAVPWRRQGFAPSTP